MAGQVSDAFEKAQAKEVDLYFQEVSLMRQLIKERHDPLELLRELVSNAAAREVQAQNIWIRCYPHPEDTCVFEVEDDGIGMDYSEAAGGQYARLNRFLSLGLSAVVGAKSDEFSWKGLGSKLAFHSRRVVVETYTGSGPVRRVEVNASWETISAGRRPKPRIYESQPGPSQRRGTKVTVAGHPPDVRREYSFSQVKDYLLHRTFIGYTRERSPLPVVHLAVGANRETLDIGFPTLKKIVGDPGSATRFVKLTDTATLDGTNRSLHVVLKGLYSIEAGRFALAQESGNTGLILSVLGIPYFDLGLEKYTGGRRGLGLNPSAKNCSLIVECDAIQEEMNISRSGITDGVIKELFDRSVKSLLRRVAESEDYKSFVAFTKREKDIRGAETLDARKRQLERPEQRWVYWTNPTTNERRQLHREPENEQDTLAVLWKLEALGSLPFTMFQSLEHGGSGADIIAHFRESPEANPERYVTIEAEHVFSNYKTHGHNPSQMPIVVCWDLGKSRKIKLKDTNSSWKFIAEAGDTNVRVYALSRMPNIYTGRST
ncbi:MAG: ATP-binding protein [Thermodesulfobacteriota bacterium]